MNPAVIPIHDVLLDLPVRSRDEALRAVAETLAGRAGIAVEPVVAALIAREAQAPTAIGHGVALPHIRLEGVDRIWVVAVRLAQPVPFGAPDGEDIRLLFAMLVPKAARTEHLEILSALASRLSDRELRGALALAPDTVSFRDLLRREEP